MTDFIILLGAIVVIFAFAIVFTIALCKIARM